MKNTGLVLALLLIVFASCEEKKDIRAETIKEKTALYEAATALGDNRTAAVALNELILLDSANLNYKDSLCRIYMKTANFEGAVKLAEIIIAAGKADLKLKELTGVSYQQIREYQKAKDLFNELFVESSDYRYLYQVAAITYESGNKAEFETATNKMLVDISTDSGSAAKTLIEVGGPISGVGQKVPLKAATLFLLGKFEQDYNKNYMGAVIYYERAIGAHEAFEMPYYYLQEIEKARKQGLIR